MGKKTKALKEKATEERFNPVQIVVIVGSILFVIWTNTDFFEDLSSITKIASYSAWIVIALFLGKSKGKVGDVVKSFMKILFSKKGNDQKISELQNLLVATARQLGLYYQKELQKLENSDITIEEMAEKDSKIKEAERTA
jgi:hypothetical protein